MQARSTIKLPVCADCGGCCCRDGSAVVLTRTDVRRIAKKIGQPLQRIATGQPTLPIVVPHKPVKRKLGGRTVTRIGALDNDEASGMCSFWSKKGCTLGAARPFHCRTYFCYAVLNWAEYDVIRTPFVPAAVEVLQAGARDYESASDAWDYRDFARELRVKAKKLRARLV